MATSGSLTLSTSNQFIFGTVAWTQTSQSVTSNNTVISWTLKFYRTNSYTTQRSFSGTININGTATTLSTSKYSFSTSAVQFASGTATIPHNADGTKTFTISCSGKLTSGSEDYTVNSNSASWSLTTIPRATTPVLNKTSIALGETIHIDVSSRASSGFTHNLKFSWGTANSVNILEGVNTGYSWTPPVSYASYLTTAVSATCTVYCITYSGSTEIGTKTATFTLTIPDSIKPTISALNTSDPTGYLELYGNYVQGKSKIRVAPTSSGVSGSTIKTTSISVNGVTTTTNPYTSNIITAAGEDKVVSVTVTDTRGRTATLSETYSVSAYSLPTISIFAASRCEQDGTSDDSGDRVKISYKTAITALNGLNTKSLIIRYKQTIEDSWTTLLTNTTDYETDTYYIAEADTNVSYTISILLEDAFGTVERQIALSSAYTLMDFNASGRGIAFGKVSEKDTFEVALPTEFTSEQEVTSATRFISFANDMGFQHRKDGGDMAVTFGVGGGGTNRGIWDDHRQNWMVARKDKTTDDITIVGDIKNSTYSLNQLGSQLAYLYVGVTPPNLPSGVSYYRTLLWATSSGNDKYWLLMSSAGKFYTGCQFNGVSTVTWNEK